jgi:lipid A disaccharide synthetase
VLLPEYLCCEDKSRELAQHCLEWLTDAQARHQRETELRMLRDSLATGGASERAAEYIALALAERPDVLPMRRAS